MGRYWGGGGGGERRAVLGRTVSSNAHQHITLSIPNKEQPNKEQPNKVLN